MKVQKAPKDAKLKKKKLNMKVINKNTNKIVAPVSFVNNLCYSVLLNDFFLWQTACVGCCPEFTTT